MTPYGSAIFDDFVDIHASIGEIFLQSPHFRSAEVLVLEGELDTVECDFCWIDLAYANIAIDLEIECLRDCRFDADKVALWLLFGVLGEGDLEKEAALPLMAYVIVSGVVAVKNLDYVA